MGKEAKFFVNTAFSVPQSVVDDGRANWLRVLDTKTIPRASTVFGSPELAQNNVAVPSVEGFNFWLSQVAAPTTVFTPSGEDINEVLLTQKINTLSRLPTKIFTEFSLALTGDDNRNAAADKWARNFGQFGVDTLQAVGINALLPGIAQATFRFLDSDFRFNRVANAQVEVTEDDGVSCFKPELSRQATSLVGLITRALVKTSQALKAGVNGTELTTFIAVQETRVIDALAGFLAAGKAIDEFEVITVPRLGVFVKCSDVTT